MFEASEVKRLIGEGLACEFIAIEGDDGVHFSGIVVSPEFDGMSTLNQHRAVTATLGSLMGNEIHALQLKTYTPARWAAVRQSLGY